MKTKYTINYFIDKFNAIPAKNWTTELYCDAFDRHCALGHCGASTKFGYTDEAQALFYIFVDSVVDINDGINPKYPQKTPKARILAALRKAKKEKK